MKRIILALTALSILVSSSVAQESLLNGITPRALGPTVMGGRIADIAVFNKDPRIFYVATAGGGLWKTESAGVKMTPVFDSAAVSGMGAVAISQKDPNIVWVGMGEASSRNSTSWGNGVYMSKDGGKIWKHMGLEATHHICDILIDPRNDDTIYVGATGRLWGASEDRGIYKSTDGGKTWDKILYVNDKTGPADFVMDPTNPNILFAAMWERMRSPFNWISGGEGSGMYKSTDAGKNWKKITKGLPSDAGVMFGRMGISFHFKDTKLMVATIEASVPTPDTAAGQWRRTTVGGTFISRDKGESWEKASSTNPRPFYFSLPRFDTQDANRIYVLGVSMHVSDDQGKTFRGMPINDRVHVDYHACWVNPTDSNHIITGSDGGVYQTRDRGVTWEHMNTMVLGQFYAIGWDNRKPYYVYGGLQDNGSWGGPTQTKHGGTTFQDWYNAGGGDGFFTVVDPNDWTTVYTESQGGAVGRQNVKTGGGAGIQPNTRNTNPPLSGRARFNWNTPIALSPFNSQTVYVGGNFLFRSVNRGTNWDVISPDLSTNNPDKLKVGFGSTTPEDTGAERHCTIVTISESPAKMGVIWVGTDDGNVWVTQDTGKTWTQVNANMPDAPKFGWVTRVHASAHEAGRAYATFDNHRMNDFNTYVYATEDFGKTWSKLNANLPPTEPVHVIRDGLKNPNLLFLGTEYGLWTSLDRGKSWTKVKAGFPTVPVNDVQIHARELDLVIGTHGRSIWTMNVSALEELTEANLAKDAHLATPQNILILGGSDGTTGDGDRVWIARNTQPGTDIFYHLKADAAGEVKVEVQDAIGTVVQSLTGGTKAGLNSVRFGGGRRLAVGDYRVVLKVGGKEFFAKLKVEDATWER